MSTIAFLLFAFIGVAALIRIDNELESITRQLKRIAAALEARRED